MSVTLLPYAKAIVQLLRGPVYSEDQEYWNQVLKYQVEITQHFGGLGLDTVIQKEDGYAFIRQLELDDRGTTIGLISRRPLTYEVSLLCVLLRKLFDDAEISNTENKRFFLKRKQLRAELETFFKEKSNKVKLLKDLDSYINQVLELGYVKVTEADGQYRDEDTFEVRSIIKARFSNDVCLDFLNQLKEDVKSV
ncbi:DUF4194 domain-containing protein [Paraflavitalea sp. CAU 1676]|jgi:hypothetical protein|uniref:DUF4194 domain-containing protein n=1 Tax=Paraflavitalea sp. CAU 1676 TaxID=3032598 RepID=UPI0023DA114E|nr:DUF4194 domain-containing protein [Paraflavitalea sp. CAU 1676]MDF2186784.1 DUF4194 domain-containing protein [Paraflavitalea sp. CAU 1676]